jgi:hypothetical protein
MVVVQVGNAVTLGAALLFIIVWNVAVPSIAGSTAYGVGQDVNVFTWIQSVASMFGNPAIGSVWLIVNAVLGVMILRGVFGTN